MTLHRYYDAMCETCGDFNYAKRETDADLCEAAAFSALPASFRSTLADHDELRRTLQHSAQPEVRSLLSIAHHNPAEGLIHSAALSQ